MKCFYLDLTNEPTGEIKAELVCNNHNQLPQTVGLAVGSLCLCTDDKSLYILGYNSSDAIAWCKIK